MSNDGETNIKNVNNNGDINKRESGKKEVIKKELDSKIERIPWKAYFLQIIKKLFVGLVILCLFIVLYSYSIKITPDTNVSDPPNIIGYFSSEYLTLIVVSSLLFLLVLAAFIKTLFIDHKQEFGIDNYKTKKVLFLFLLVVSFISAVYTILDVALKNVYMTIGPMDVVWAISNYFIPLPTINYSTDLLAYAKIRAYFFFGFYLFMLVFPIFMFFSLLTRYGRNRVFKKPEERHMKEAKTSLTLLGIVLSPLLIIFLVNLLNSSVMTEAVKLIVELFLIVVILYWIYLIIKVILKGIKLTALFSYANTIIFFPLIFLFYLLPIIFWTGWDVFMILSTGSTTKTVLTELNTPLANMTVKVSSTTIQNQIGILFQIVLTNGVDLVRIIQLDFVFVVAISALAIGFAEGLSIIAIFSALFKGVSIARTGRVASQSAPKIVVITSRVIMLGAWISFFWDRIVVITEVLKTYFIQYFGFLKNINLPRIFEIFQNLHFNIEINFLQLAIPLSLLLIPLFYIIMSSFKFLSVSLLVERTKNDQQTFFLLISSAFVLITTNILQDISDSVPLNDQSFLPTAFIPTAQFFLTFANKIFEFLESVAFYIGMIAALYLMTKKLLKKIKERNKEQEIQNREKYYGTLH